MKTLERIKLEVFALEIWTIHEDLDEVINEVAKRYAKEVAREALRNASENAKTTQGYCSDGWSPSVKVVDKQSILNESNIPEL